MPLLLPSILANSQRSHHPFLLLQSSSAQSCVQVLRSVINHRSHKNTTRLILLCFLHPSLSLLAETKQGHQIEVHDYTDKVPGYDDCGTDPRDDILLAVKAAPPGSLDIIVDSVDTLASDLGSPSQTYTFLFSLISLIRARPTPSTLTLQVLYPSPLLPLLTQTLFSPSITHIISHPPILLTHLSTAYSTPPPPSSTPEKFWGVFIPISERVYESEKLVFGPGGEGPGGGEKVEFVVEVLVRGGGDGRRRAVERVLEGWSVQKGGPCDLISLDSLKSIWTRKVVEEGGPDPTQNISFNLNLTQSQQQSRAQVPLPYAHEGKPIEKRTTPAAILYDPDSADDIDDDDPDEDLDI
ncbi:hypothetical protein PILCRDRAFT_96413 [Piloderma croceum F 1598]|uniref:Elongator complex protein 5 n=1 Tax=Piloderma croceum (strain F 1598) TaxID=765440 RepID=A0A0C3C6J8_PILCF|nr:hypothetical protein PILCRDRAFT_96413 [Piloderma croceum F 1598]